MRDSDVGRKASRLTHDPRHGDGVQVYPGDERPRQQAQPEERREAEVFLRGDRFGCVFDHP